MNSVIAEANLITSENAEYIFDRTDVEQVELSSGTTEIYGNLSGDYIRDGFKILTGDIDSIMRRVQPEDLYTIGPKQEKAETNTITSMLKTDSYIRIVSYWGGTNNSNDWGRIVAIRNEKYEIVANQISYNIYLFLEDKPKYIGFFYADISGEPQPIFVSFNENKKLIPIALKDPTRDTLTYGVTIDINSVGNKAPFTNHPLSNIEQQYYKGLTEIRTHISKEEYKRLIEESNASSDP